MLLGDLYLLPLVSFCCFRGTYNMCDCVEVFILHPTGGVMVSAWRVTLWVSTAKPVTVSADQWVCARGSGCVLVYKGKGKDFPLQARCGPEGGTGIAILFHDRGTRRGWMVSSTPRPHFTPGKDPVLILQEAGWAPGPVWTGGKSRPHRDSIPDRPARSQSLYRLSYPAHVY